MLDLRFEIDGEPAPDPGEPAVPAAPHIVPGRVVRSPGPTAAELAEIAHFSAALGFEFHTD